MQHLSHYKERSLYVLFIALFAFSIIFLLLNIDSFTGLLSMRSAQIVNSCDKTLPPSIQCTNGECSDGFVLERVLTKNGEGLCCCRPPPEIDIIISK